MAQQTAFLNFMEGHPVYDYWKSSYTFFIGADLRIEELSGLIWKDIDAENGVITVDHAAVYFAGKMNKSQKRIYIYGLRRAGSMSKQVYPNGRIERSENVKDMDLYVQKIDEIF